ncbi:P-loop NTPase fold protein [Rhodopseudomonas sp. B29]|uniref:KAP family P-loop NTPase fold protein n=1 Tax=Rhodopseudomonas sp. B29 TaxID=95607 RepID=UPI000344BB1A|nr:P-loop NTPase fold protein [Rhodopseudomonas sp. B29]
MTDYYNDSPIEDFEDDCYGITPFAKALAKSLVNINKPIGTTIALNGAWGFGKSSAVNLIRKELNNIGDEKLVVSDFKCWWYRGEEALALAFLQELHSTLRDKLGDKVKDLVPSLAQRLLQAGPVIGTAVSLASGSPLAALIPGASKFMSAFFPDGNSVEKTFKKLSKVLEAEDRRFLIIIDDIDRLNPEEAISVFRLVKSVGQLPNVMYLLVFDRLLADKAVEARYPSEGPHFLEKIIQAGFELPAPMQTDLNNATLSSLQRICGSPDQHQIRRTMNVFYDVVAPYITSPRHVTRFQNAISVTWPAIANEVSLADFIALETLRLYEPTLFRAIRAERASVCGTRRQGDPDQRDERRFDSFLQEVPETRREVGKRALLRLFPRLESMGYGDGFQRQWDAERRVCIECHFDTYFRLSLSDETISLESIKTLIARSNEREFVQATMRKAAQTERRNGTSLIPVYLDELTTHALSVKKEDVSTLLASLFEIHDEIDLEKDEDRGFMAIANTTFRFHWLIRRLTDDRFTIAERSEMYMNALTSASIGWLVDFVSSARSQYRERDGSQRNEEDCLVSQDLLPNLSMHALRAIRSAAADRSLLLHRDLVYILYRWRDFLDNDPSEVRRWTDSLLSDPEALVILARGFTSQSWSMGMGGFGALEDRVSTPTTIVQISDKTNILDVEAFRKALERFGTERTVDRDTLITVEDFLDNWNRKSTNED